jgi:5-methylcytosine-specific restriction endonuclease McrA
VPQVVICSNFDKVIFNKVVFPTKHNIYKRDNYTCLYTGAKLSKEQLSIDHVIPKSKGGADTWENLATCNRLLNSKKGNKTLAESGLKLKYKPFKPKNGLILSIYKTEWASFLKNL